MAEERYYDRRHFGGVNLYDVVEVTTSYSNWRGQKGLVTRIVVVDGEGTLFVRLPSGSVLPFGYSEVELPFKRKAV